MHIFEMQKGLKINPLSLHHEKLKKEGQIKSKVNKINEIIEIREKVNEIVKRKSIEKIKQNKIWFFEKMNIIGFICFDFILFRLRKEGEYKLLIS